MGLTTSIAYDGNFWKEAKYHTHPSFATNAFYSTCWAAKDYPDYIFLRKHLYKNNDGDSTVVTFSNGCGEKQVTINFKYMPARGMPYGGYSQILRFYHYGGYLSFVKLDYNHNQQP